MNSIIYNKNTRAAYRTENFQAIYSAVKKDLRVQAIICALILVLIVVIAAFSITKPTVAWSLLVLVPVGIIACNGLRILLKMKRALLATGLAESGPVNHLYQNYFEQKNRPVQELQSPSGTLLFLGESLAPGPRKRLVRGAPPPEPIL